MPVALISYQWKNILLNTVYSLSVSLKSGYLNYFEDISSFFVRNVLQTPKEQFKCGSWISNSNVCLTTASISMEETKMSKDIKIKGRKINPC